MTATATAGCARCGTILDPQFRFCPECGLPASGESVLSTEIADLRHRVEAEASKRTRAPWHRYVLRTVITAMFVFVVVLGLLLFNRPLLDRWFAATGPDADTTHLVTPPRWEPEWTPVTAGSFPYGDPGEHREGEVPYGFLMSKHEVANSLWFDFLANQREHLLAAGLWDEAFPKDVDGWSEENGAARLVPERRPYPVRNISPVAIAEFCWWLTKRLGQPSLEIRMPTRLEWERAARGSENRTYTWGDDDVLVTMVHTGGKTRPRTGINSAAYPVADAQLALEDTSPFGVVAMGTNVSEWTVMPELYTTSGRKADIEEYVGAVGLRAALEAKNLRVARRGASHLCDEDRARRLAKVWSLVDSDPREQRMDVGIRLVKIKVGK